MIVVVLHRHGEGVVVGPQHGGEAVLPEEQHDHGPGQPAHRGDGHEHEQGEAERPLQERHAAARAGDLGRQAAGAGHLRTGDHRRPGRLVTDLEDQVGHRADLGGGRERHGELLGVHGRGGLGDQVAQIGPRLGGEDQPAVVAHHGVERAEARAGPLELDREQRRSRVGHRTVGRRPGSTHGVAVGGDHHDVGLVAAALVERAAGPVDGPPEGGAVEVGLVGRRRHPVDGGQHPLGVGGQALDLLGAAGGGVHADELLGALRLAAPLDPLPGRLLGRHQGPAAVHGAGGVEHQGDGGGVDGGGGRGRAVTHRRAVVGEQGRAGVGRVAGVQELDGGRGRVGGVDHAHLQGVAAGRAGGGGPGERGHRAHQHGHAGREHSHRAPPGPGAGRPGGGHGHAIARRAKPSGWKTSWPRRMP